MDMNKGAFVAVLLIAALSISCFAGGAYASGNGIVEALNAIGSLSNFSSDLQQAGLVNTLNNDGILVFGNNSFIVFAPSDAAFANVTGIDLKANETVLKNVLSYHIVEAGRGLGNLTNGTTLETLMGENLTVNTDDGLTINGAKVLNTQKYDNGTIYVIDRVLLPVGSGGRGVVEVANEMGLTEFAKVVQNAGYEESLNGQGVFGIGALTDGPFTVFAPSNEAFDAKAATMTEISANKDDLKALLGYHVVSKENAVNMTKPNSAKTMEGSFQGVDFKEGIVGGARILKAQRYDNGIIYEIDQLLIPMKLSMKA